MNELEIAMKPKNTKSFQDLAGNRLDERIYQELLTRIHGGTYELGAKLPTELALSEEYAVSRTVIRVVLARLRQSGIIESKRGSGSYISSGPTDASSGYAPLVSISDISQYYAFRIILESESAALAALSKDEERIALLQASVSEMDAEIESGTVTIQRDFNFHGIIAEMSGNRFIGESLLMLRPHIQFVGRFVRSLSPSGYVRAKSRMALEHHRILDAIVDGDAQAARSRMREHIEASQKRAFSGES